MSRPSAIPVPVLPAPVAPALDDLGIGSLDCLSGIPPEAPRPPARGRCGLALQPRGRFPVICGAAATVVGRDLALICEHHAAQLLGFRWRERAVFEGGFWFLPGYLEALRAGAGR